MQKGYHLAGLAQLPNTAEQMQLSIAALLKTTGAQLQALRLSASEDAYVALEGTADWKNALQADAQVQWQNFPWHSLLAQDDIPVQLQTLTGRLAITQGDYNGSLDGAFKRSRRPFYFNHRV